MRKFFGLGNETPEEVQAMLEAQADAIKEDFSYTRLFTQEELDEKKELQVEMSQKLKRLQSEKKDAMAAFKAQIDPVQAEVNELLDQLKDKGEQITGGTGFIIFDHEERKVGTYSPDGYLIEERPMRKTDAKQDQSIFKLQKTGTDGNGDFKIDMD